MSDKNHTTKFVVPSPPQATTKFELRSPRGAKLAGRTWSPPGQPKALVLIVHGGGWHSGYFGALAEYLVAKNQVFVASYDQPGCGYSEKEPSAPEGTVHFDTLQDLVDDVFTALEWARKEAGDDTKKSLPVFLLGESFGGIITLQAAFESVERGIALKGAVVLGSVLRLAPGLLPPWPVVTILRWLAPYFPRTVMPATDFESTFDDAFGDKRWAAVARQDPRITINMRPTLAAATATLSSGDVIMANAPNFPSTISLLAVHGQRDCRTQCEAVQEFVDKAGSNARMEVVDTDGHQLLQDMPEVTGQVMETISTWIQDTLSSK